MRAIGCLDPNEEPKCTAHIDGMVAMISDLIEKGFAYESDGHVFFDVSKYDDYGQLSGNNLESLRGGDRVGEGEVARKRNAADFVLWKPELDGVGWDAPFGKGRPGWHIECSAMAKAVLTDGTKSDTIDIHCGGVDLKFPHHENEIAQSNCSHDAPLANYWVHNEFLNMGDEKMSKSLGNVKLIHALRKDWDGEVIRLALLKAHYRSELVWTEDLLKESKVQLDGWYRYKKIYLGMVDIECDVEAHIEELTKDLNTPEMLADLDNLSDLIYEDIYKLAKDNNTDVIESEWLTYCDYDFLVRRANLLGLLQKVPDEWFKGGASVDEEAEFDAIAMRRQEARAQKDWAAADAARDEATAKGIVLEDGPDGTTWRKA